MKADVKEDISFDRLNALIDGELDRSDEGRLLYAIHGDAELAQRVFELRNTKDLVRHAYRLDARDDGKPRQRSPPRWRLLAAAAVTLVTVAAGGGWAGHAWQQRGDDTDFTRLVQRASVAPQAAAPDKILLHVSSSAPEQLTEMLDETESLLGAARQAGRPLAIEILANSTGIDVLRAGVPGPAARLASLRAEYPNLTLVACRQTIERLREKGIVVHLLPEASVATTALDEVVRRIHEGWTYVRT